MTVRFLQTTPSPVPGFPFQVGQVVSIDPPPTWLLALCDGVRAEAVKDTEPEYAVATAPRRVRGKRRG